MDEDREERPAVAFLGPKASYTHQATLNIFPDSTHTLIPKTHIEDVFASVQHSQTTTTTTFGVVPFENSTNGAVKFTLDLLADAGGKYPDVLVCGEVYLPVHHCLVGFLPKHHASSARKSNLLQDEEDHASGTATPTPALPSPSAPRAKPRCDLAHITKLYSHPQAWGQCKTFTSTFLKHAERQDVSSTSRAAEVVASEGGATTTTTAAISSRLAAEMNGLDVLADSIEDNEGNSTRFFVLRRRRGAGSGGEEEDSEGGHVEGKEDEMRDYKSMISFTVDHGEAGALADCLAVLKRYGLNLTSINTMPSGDAAWHYIFLVELVGMKRGDGQKGAVNEALEELGRVAKTWRWLGSWSSARR